MMQYYKIDFMVLIIVIQNLQMSVSKQMRYYQKNADIEISTELSRSKSCLIKMFCGTGKSLIMRRCQELRGLHTVVYVFPSLALINQFYTDYLKPGSKTCDPKDQVAKTSEHVKDAVLCISCETDATTDTEKIRAFLMKPDVAKKYILVTYNSYHILLDTLNKLHICVDAVVFDEAHHTVSPTYKKLVYEDTQNVSNYRLFFTATPRNVPSITMFDRTQTHEVGDCGKLVVDYTYLDGLGDEYLNAFEVRADCYSRNDLNSIFKCIARTILYSGNTRVLTFHSDVNGDRDKTVSRFVKLANDKKHFAKLFRDVLETEFPDKVEEWSKSKITITSLDATVKGDLRSSVIDELDKTLDTNIFILASCQTIGEGVDTKRANMCVFVDPKSSHHQIIQNIGRIVRKPKTEMRPATILLPVWIDCEKYKEYIDDPAGRDHAIREDMDNDEDGNYNPILNVIAALKTEDPDIADIILKYPTKFSPREISRHLRKHNMRVCEKVGDGSAKETLEHLLNTSIEVFEEETVDELVERVSKQHNTCVEIHQHSLDNSVEHVNEAGLESGIVRMLQDETGGYLPIQTTELREPKKKTPKINKKSRPKISARCDDEIASLWKVSDLTDTVRSVSLECNTVARFDFDRWRLKLAQGDEYIVANNKRPSNHDKNKDIKTLATWIQTQQRNYAKSEYIMSDPEIRKEWERFVEKHNEHFMSNEAAWRQMLIKVDEYIVANNKRPSHGSKNKDIKALGLWVYTQNQSYPNSRHIMSDPEIRKEWEQFVEKHKEHFRSNEDAWIQMLAKADEYIISNNKRPSSTDKNKDIKTLGSWIGNQQTNYAKSEQIMSDPEIRNEWERFVEKHNEHFMSNADAWRNTLETVDEYIVANNKRPSSTDKNKDIKTLANWIQSQLKNYAKSEYIMSDPEIRKEWEQFVEKHKEHFMSNEAAWRQMLIKVDEYIVANNKRPSIGNSHKDIKKLATWINHQQHTYPKSEFIMSDPEIRKEWEVFTTERWPELFNTSNTTPPPTPKKSMTLVTVPQPPPPPPTPIETPEGRRVRVKSELSILHQKYKTMTSKNLATLFTSTPQVWHTYHEISETNEQSFDNAAIPRNRIIQELRNIKNNSKNPKMVVDMGCGKAHISRYFKNDKRFEFRNYDHVSSSEDVVSCDISSIGLDDNSVDYCILSLAMWGSNCQEYIIEAYRMLVTGGRLYIIEPTKRWSDTTPDGKVIEGTQGCRLMDLLDECCFRIDRQYIDKFCMFVCSRID